MYQLIDVVTPTLEQGYRAAHEGQIRIQAKNIFINGLKEPFSLLLKARNPETLEGAIGLAITEEREINCRRDMFRGPSYDRRGDQGPSQKENPRLTGENSRYSGRNQFNGNFGNGKNSRGKYGARNGGNFANRDNFNRSNPRPFNGQKSEGDRPSSSKPDGNSKPQYCRYCKIPGHDISECRRKKQAESGKKIFSLNSNSASGPK